MANGMNQVMRTAVLRVNTEIKDSYGCQWASEAMRRLGTMYDTALIPNAEPLVVELDEDTPYTLPDGCKAVTRVEDEYGTPIKRYTVDTRNRLRVPYSGTFTIEYLSYAPSVLLMSDDPAVDPAYWDVLGIYVAISHLRSVGAEKDYKEQLEKEFADTAADVDARLRRRKRTGFIPVRMWR